MAYIKDYIAVNEPKMMEDLFSLIRIPSISALPEHHDDMLACAQRWTQLLLEAGADEAIVMPSQGNPIVFGQKIVDPNAKTVLATITNSTKWYHQPTFDLKTLSIS